MSLANAPKTNVPQHFGDLEREPLLWAQIKELHTSSNKLGLFVGSQTMIQQISSSGTPNTLHWFLLRVD